MSTPIRLTFFSLILLLFQSSIATTIEHNKFDIEREINLAVFTKLFIYGNVEVFITESPIQKVTIVGPEEVVKDVSYSNEEGELRLVHGNKYDGKNRIQLHIQLQKIDAIFASGAVDIIGEGLFSMENGKLEAIGNSSIQMELDAKNIELFSKGYGKIGLAGKANTLDLNVEDKAMVEAVNLFVEYASINTSSSQDVYIDAFRKIDVTISSKGDVICKSKPMINTMNKSGKGQFIYSL